MLSGSRVKTNGGIEKAGLIKNKRGKVVSKKQSLKAKKMWKSGSGIAKWHKAVMAARKKLGLTGFHLCPKGSKFYKTARSIYNKM